MNFRLWCARRRIRPSDPMPPSNASRLPHACVPSPRIERVRGTAIVPFGSICTPIRGPTEKRVASTSRDQGMQCTWLDSSSSCTPHTTVDMGTDEWTDPRRRSTRATATKPRRVHQPCRIERGAKIAATFPKVPWSFGFVHDARIARDEMPGFLPIGRRIVSVCRRGWTPTHQGTLWGGRRGTDECDQRFEIDTIHHTQSTRDCVIHRVELRGRKEEKEGKERRSVEEPSWLLPLMFPR